MKKKIIVFFLFFSLIGFSQKNNDTIAILKKQDHSINVKKGSKKKPNLRVGLVLSGGGAKGFAHIGVLKVLDKLGVRIDYIGGTSAGAMIGGLYASGYSAKEIDSIIRSYDFNDLIQDHISRDQFSLYQKEKSERYALNLPIKNWKVSLPVALYSGQNILNEMTKLTKHVHNIDDFSQLPIPFFCLATDIETGKKVVLENGFLPLAIRASGSFPTLLQPVEIDGQLLVDGGIVANFPIDIMYEKDVDIIIGVDVQDHLGTRENLDSAPKIVMQIISFQMYKEVEENKDRTDVYLKPNISKYNVLSFDKVAEIIEEGERIANQEIDFLKGIAEQQQNKKVVKKKINIQKGDKIYIESIKISGHKNYTKNYILSKLNLKNKDSITYEQFNKCIQGLSATENFKSIDYKFTLLPNNKSIIEFNLKENDVSNSLHLSAHYDDLYKTGVLINFTSKHALTNNDLFSVDFILGDNLRYNVDYIIDNGFYWQFGFKSRYNSFKRGFTIDKTSTNSIFNDKQQINYNDYTNQVYLGSKFKEKLGFKIGIEHKNLRIYTEIDDSDTKQFFDKNNYFNLFGKMILDTYDAKYFTKKGWNFNAQYALYFTASDNNNQSFEPFSQISGNIGHAKTFYNKFTLQFTADFGLTIGDNPESFNYFIGGYNQNFINNFIPFYGYSVGAINNTTFIKGASTFRYEIIPKNYLSFTSNVIASTYEDIFGDDSILDDSDFTVDFKSGYAVGYGIKSIVGPIELKYSWSPEHNIDFWSFNIGFWF